ncbi:MAG: hypothetical protein NT121_08760 [Chloroflexi bacterium]|nr:hypothetical protein [Chloroflexota bacterium]
MKTSQRILVLAIIVLLSGLGLFCLGLMLDPFSLPFQDYEQMPLATQQAYETRAAWMQIIRLSGCGITVLALLGMLLTWLVGRRRPQG